LSCVLVGSAAGRSDAGSRGDVVSRWLARILGRRAVPQAAAPPARAEVLDSASEFATDAEREFASGLALFQAGRYEEAAARFEAATEARHDWAEAHYRLGLSHHYGGRPEDACDAFALALHHAPHAGHMHFALALAERKQGKIEQAWASVTRAIGCGHDTPEAHNLEGALLLDMGRIEEAVERFRAAVRIDPANAQAHGNLGYVLFRDCGEYEAGAHHLERALALDPSNLDSRCNYTMVLAHRGEHERALALADEILALRPELDEARLNRALVHLKLGQYEAGWTDYEARKRVRSNFIARKLPWPEWQGEPLAGKTILVHGEQGLGDEIMFASCFPEVIARAERCVIECAPALQPLFARSFPQASVFAGKQGTDRPDWIAHAPQIDIQLSAGSLPLHLRRSPEAFPMHRGYLMPASDRVAHWRARLAALGAGPKVGISWRGGLASTRRNLRSIDLAEWAPLLQTPGARFVSLQYGDTRQELDQLAAAHGVGLTSWREAIDDMDESAALVGALDLVISVCTTVIHLAGAVGRPVWILVPTVPEWRYQAVGTAMPWYPSATLVRQQSAGDWRPQLAEIADRLRGLVHATGDIDAR